LELSLFNYINDHDKFIDFIINRPDKNIFKSLRKIEFDYSQAWKDIYKRDPLLMNDSLLLPFGSSILILLKQSFVKKIFIWSEEYDKRIHFDIQENFGLDRVAYVTGEFKEAITNLPTITCYVLDDVTKLTTLIEMNKVDLATVCIADYGYNYNDTECGIKRELKLPELYKLEDKHRFRSTLFKAIQN
jgi:hypothetical protein